MVYNSDKLDYLCSICVKGAERKLMGKKESEKKTPKKKAGTEKSATGINKIGTKVLLVAAIVLALSLSITIVIASNFAENRLLESEQKGIINVAGEKATSIEQYVADQKAIAQLVQTNSVVIQAAATYQADGTIDPTVQTNVANSLATLYENTGEIYENLFVTVGSEGFADCVGNTTLHDVSEENFYIECQNNGYYFGNNVSPVTGRPIYVIAYAITAPNSDKMIGSVNMSIDMASMGKDIVQSDDYDITVLDHEGLVVATNGSEEDILTSVKDSDEAGFNDMLNTEEGCKIVDLSTWGLGENYIAYHTSENFIMEVTVGVDEIVAPAKEMSRNLTFIAVFMIVVAIILLFVLIQMIVKPLKVATKDVNGVIAEIKSGRGDLTKQIPVKSKDEIGVLVTCVNELLDTLKSLISNVQSTTSNVTLASSSINDEIGHAEMEISNVSSTMEQMSASSQETSASLSQVMVQVDSVAELVQEVNKSSVDQARYAAEVVAKVKDIQDKSVMERETANQQLNQVTESLRVKIDNAKQVSEIANLTDEILSITSQTNLLSLNASIEAARAGEAGKGFAVVADEIRQLADSSKEAANRIQEVTESVIKAVEALADEASTVTDFMLESNESGHAETDALTQSYADDISKLADAMEDFQAHSDEIQNSMEMIKEAIDAVNIAAEETAQGITNVAASTVELSNNLQSVVGKASDNVAETSSLNDEMNKFRV